MRTGLIRRPQACLKISSRQDLLGLLAKALQLIPEQLDGDVRPHAGDQLVEAHLDGLDWDRMMTFYGFPKEHWKHLRTSNVVESPFAAVRLRTTAAKRYKRVENATAVIWKTLLVAENNFRRLDHPELLSEVSEGATYIDGVRVKRNEAEEAA